MKSSKRLIQLNSRMEWLLDQAEAELHPKKMDRHAFAYDNLSDRYNSKSQRLRRIQRLAKRTEEEARELVDEVLADY